MKVGQPRLLITLVGALTASSVASVPAKLPRYVDTKLAGTYLLKSPYFHAYDSRTGYYLWVEHDFDGASNTIFVTSDPRLFGRPKYPSSDARPMSFPLVTGRGIRVGDSIKRLHRTLGQPISTNYRQISGSKRRVDSYGHNNKKLGSQRRHYEADYISRKGHIEAIRFSYYRGTW